MNFVKKYVPFFSITLIVILLIIFRSIPTGHLWEGYRVLYVSADTDENFVTEALQNYGVSEFVSLNKQRVPVLLNQNSLEATLLRLNFNSNSAQYLDSRENYFFDFTGDYKLFYIPNSYENNLNNCIKYLEKNFIKTGLDNSFSYPWLLPILLILLAIMITFFSKNKFLFISECIIPIIYAFCNPFYSSCVAVVLLMVVLFFISNLWGRKNALKFLSKAVLIIVILAVSIISAFSATILSGLFYILTLGGIAAVLIAYNFINGWRLKKKNFVPVFIKPAKMISVFGGKGKIVMPVSIGVAAIIIIYFALTTTTNVASSKKILLPGNSSQQSEKLPTLEDFYYWNWQIFTAPYKSLNKNSENEFMIVYPSFSIQDGIINENEIVYTYNDSFKQKTYEEIDKLDFDSIEKVIKNQGENFASGYVSTGAYKNSLFSIIMMFICLAMLLFIYFSVIMKKGGRK